MSATIREESFSYFLTEAQDLLQTIEQGLFTLRENRTTTKVHELMRAAHTLKGAAASVDLEMVKSVAHVLEDIFRVFYNPEAIIDAEIESLLFEGYECLRIAVTAMGDKNQADDTDLLNRTANIIARIQTKMGDSFSQETNIPTSAELGFDIVQSMFEVGVTQRLEELNQALQTDYPTFILQEFRTKAEIFQGLAESLGLPGLGAIAETILAALELHPDQVVSIAKVALQDLYASQKAVLAGDRTQGGGPSPALESFIDRPTSLSSPTQPLPPFEASFQTNLNMDLDENLDVLNLDSLIGEMETPKLPNRDHSSESEINSAMDVHGLEALVGELEPVTVRSLNQVPLEATIDHNPTPPKIDSTDSFEALEALIDLLPPLIPESPSGGQTNQPSLQSPAQAPPNFIPPSLSPTTLTDLPSTEPQVIQSTSNSFPASNSAITPDVLPATSAGNSIRVEVAQIERLDHLTGELLINQNRQTNQNEHLRSHLRRLLEQLQQHRRTIYELRDWSDRTLTGQRPTSRFKTLTDSRRQHLATPTGLVSNGLPLVPQFDAIEMDRYSQLNVLVQNALNETVELEETTEEIEQKTRQSSQTLEGQQRLLSHMRDDLTHARMQPLGILLNRFPRVLKQLVEAHQKRVELFLEGTEVLVDKAVIDKLYDPLLHLIRNAFDHGIESLEARRAHGKPDVGRIKLQAYQRGNYTYINVIDDGQGINLNKLAERAVTLSFYNREQVASASDYQLMELLFQPGFSTMANVSELSGRGIGLDIVRNQIQNLKGNVSIHSTLGQGTTFSLKIPLSLTINRLLVCETNGFTYALPSDLVERIIMPTPGQIRSLSQDRQALLLNHQGEERLVALYSLANLMPYRVTQDQFRAIRPSAVDTSVNQQLQRETTQLQAKEQKPVLLVRLAEGLVGWSIDQVMGEQELVIRPLGTAIAPPPYFYGSSILSDSRLALVLDPIALMQYHQSTQQAMNQVVPRSSNRSTITETRHQASLPETVSIQASSQSPEERFIPPGAEKNMRAPNKVLLVVDDSLTLRRSLTQTLKRAGYEVLQAKDGLDALHQVEELQNPNLISSIICDVEMPRMNGFEFLTQFRKQPTTSKIPVVMLTSRTHEKYRRIAQTLGANAYLTKPYNDIELLSILTDVQTKLVSV